MAYVANALIIQMTKEKLYLYIAMGANLAMLILFIYTWLKAALWGQGHICVDVVPNSLGEYAELYLIGFFTPFIMFWYWRTITWE